MPTFPRGLAILAMMAGSNENGKGKRKVRNEYEEELDLGKPKKIPRTLVEKDTQKRLIVVLENASLETIKVAHIWYKFMVVLIFIAANET